MFRLKRMSGSREVQAHTSKTAIGAMGRRSFMRWRLPVTAFHVLNKSDICRVDSGERSSSVGRRLARR